MATAQTGLFPDRVADHESVGTRGHVRPVVEFKRNPGFGRRLRMLLDEGRSMFGLRSREPHRVMLDAIERNPRVFGGAAVVIGTRVPVFAIYDRFSAEDGGMEAVLRAFPHLSEADVYAALSYHQAVPAAVQRDRERYVAQLPEELRV